MILGNAETYYSACKYLNVKTNNIKLGIVNNFIKTGQRIRNDFNAHRWLLEYNLSFLPYPVWLPRKAKKTIDPSLSVAPTPSMPINIKNLLTNN